MTLDPAAIEQLIAKGLTAVAPQSDPPTAATVLFGPGAKLDSMGLVTLVVDVEQQLQQTFNLTITLADDRAMSQRSSPFRTIGTLRDYILLLAGEKA